MNVHDFTVRGLRGEDKKLSEYAGKTLLIVNTATGCGFAGQMNGFQTLYERYKEKGFEILAFPSDSFKQERHEGEEIAQVCSLKYKTTFPIFDKIAVRGKNIDPLFDHLTKMKRGRIGRGVKWNYTKFLVDSDGVVRKRYSPNVEPESIESDILALLDG